VWRKLAFSYILEVLFAVYLFEQRVLLSTSVIGYWVTNNFLFEIEPSITRMKMGSDRGAQIDPEGEGVGRVLACKIVFIYHDCNLQAALFLFCI